MNDSSDKDCPDKITLLGAWFLGALLLFSALAKFLSIGGFEVYLVQQHLVPSREWAAYAARILLAAELFLGVSCFRRTWLRRVALPLSFAMIAAFSGYLAYRAFVRNDTGSCHCFGDLIPASPRLSLVKNVWMLLLISGLFWKTRGLPVGTWRVPAAFAAASVALVFAAAPVRSVKVPPTGRPAPQTPSRFAEFRHFSGGRTVNLTTGVCLVAFVSLDCEHCIALMKRLGESARSDVLPPVYALCLGEEKDAPAFFTTAAADCPYLCVSPGIFFEFIGNVPPRLYLLKNGQPLTTWDGEAFSAVQLVPWL